MSNRTGTIA